MELFNPNIEKCNAEEQKKAGYEKISLDNYFSVPPAEQARAAKSAGLKIFQINLPMIKKRGFVTMFDIQDDTKPQEYSNVIQSIEKEGWHFHHVDCVYRIIGSVSRDRLLTNGQKEAVSTEIVGVHIFYANKTNIN
ncbi:MAG: hypothetical protein A4E66_02558 [Syntrophus sp. PtaB.Bin001]|nr:MAG: hypothetical protein A4E66_02558 [Syntrophus sp. PtaB.Bin001]